VQLSGASCPKADPNSNPKTHPPISKNLRVFMDTSVEVRKGFVGYLARPVASGAQKKNCPNSSPAQMPDLQLQKQNPKEQSIVFEHLFTNSIYSIYSTKI